MQWSVIAVSEGHSEEPNMEECQIPCGMWSRNDISQLLHIVSIVYLFLRRFYVLWQKNCVFDYKLFNRIFID